MYSKKSQGAIEFMMILFFILIIISLIMSVIGVYLLDVEEQNSKKRLDDFADNILIELEILENMEDGYYRRFDIPFHMTKKYVMRLNHSYLILQDMEFAGNDSDEFYYYLPGNFNVTLNQDYTLNVSYFTFIKENNIDYENFIDIG